MINKMFSEKAQFLFKKRLNSIHTFFIFQF